MTTLAYAMKINAKEIHAIATIFSEFVRYRTLLASEIISTAEKTIGDFDIRMLSAWHSFKQAVGNNRALGIYWIWTKTLPVNKRPEIDPDGN